MSALDDALLAASIFAVDPVCLGGVCLRSVPQPTRDQWLKLLRELLPAGPVRRISSNIGDDRLLGGLDLAATLKANRVIAERGVLAESDGGIVVVSMAERLSSHTAACLNAVLDEGEVAMSREGVSQRLNARIGVVALDEGIAEDEFVPHSLLDRLALLLDFNSLHTRAELEAMHGAEDIRVARDLLPQVEMRPDVIDAICATALALGAGSPRVSMLACRVARISAALDGRVEVNEEDASLAGRLVLAPRATRLPAPEQPEQPEQPPQAEQPPPETAQDPPPPEVEGQQSPADSPPNDGKENSQELDDKVLEAVQAAIPSGLLASLTTAPDRTKTAARSRGRAGAERAAVGRGRPSGVRQGLPERGARLNVTATLRAAALWQRLRGRADGDGRLRIEAADFRVTRNKQRMRTVTIFAVDASGSSALNRLAEAKGAVELLLADCYIRRDMVSVIAFRGRVAEVLLPPTRSLVRAKRSLASLPGGGGTPMASAIEAAAALAQQAKRRGESATIVVLSDGRSNVARNGEPGREAAHRDALGAAKWLRALNIAALFVDTSPRPNPVAKELAAGMNAKYVPLPYVNAHALSDVVKQAARAAAS